jgi:hypothetical protein
MIESDVAMVGLVVIVMLWDKYLRHRIEMTKLKQEKTISITDETRSLSEDDVVEIIQNHLPETDKEIKIFK